MRQFLERLAEVIWSTLLQFAPFELSGKPEAIRFLEKHAATYLAGFDVEAAVKQVQGSAPPTRYSALFRPPHLMSPRRSSGGKGNPRLTDDLSERIYVGYHALRRAGVRDARGKVAEALNRQGLSTRAHKNTVASWGPYEVSERVKQYEKKLKECSGAGPQQRTAKQNRESLVDSWILSFHARLCVEGYAGDPV